MAYGKDELFATVDAEPRSIARYVKTLAVVAIVVLAIVAAVVYFNLPKMGDEAKAPPGLEDAVREHLNRAEKREPTDEMKFFYCKDYYAAQVKVKPKRANSNGQSERVTDNYDLAASESRPGQWTVTAKPDFEIDGSQRPCWWQKPPS